MYPRKEVFPLREIFTPGHLLIIAAVALIFFGPAKLPELGRGFGKMIREFKSGTKESLSDDRAEASKISKLPVESSSSPDICRSSLQRIS